MDQTYDSTEEVEAIASAADLERECLELVEELDAVRVERRQLGHREGEIKERLNEILGGATALVVMGEPILTVTESVRSGVDRKKLEAMFPDVFADVRTESTARTMNIEVEGVAKARARVDGEDQ